jgi:hypothetical protein
MPPQPSDLGKLQASEKLAHEIAFVTGFTAIAAAIYVSIAFALSALLLKTGISIANFGELFVFAGITSGIGLLAGTIALLFGAVVVPLSYGFLYVAGKLLQPTSKAAIAGGNAAGLFTLWLCREITVPFVWHDKMITLVGPVLAIFMGQLGARIGQWQSWHENRKIEEIAEMRTYRFTLRQLFALTTAICLATAGLRILATWNWQFAFCPVCAVLTQIVLLPVTNFLASRLFLRWQRRTAIAEPGGEPHPP